MGSNRRGELDSLKGPLRASQMNHLDLVETVDSFGQRVFNELPTKARCQPTMRSSDLDGMTGRMPRLRQAVRALRLA